MNLSENIKEGVKAIRANLLRTILTALIIGIGIMALVGILTAIDGLQASVDDSFADLGANSFDIRNSENRRGGGMRRRKKSFPPIEYWQAKLFKERYSYPAKVSISATISGIAEAKYLSKKTNPNSTVRGINEDYLYVNAFDIEQGRNFSNIELEQGTFAAIVGKDIIEKLFGNQNPLNKTFQVLGASYKIVGILKSTGSSMGGSGADRAIFIPLDNARRLATNELTFNMKVTLQSGLDFTYAIGEAESLMRQIRKDAIGQPNSFEIDKSETLAERMDNITSYLKVGGGLVGFVTLLGAAIGLMNIMMVSVTERTREIGVRKALGATPYRIRQQFLIEAIVICLLGGLIGTVLGILIGNLVSYLVGVEKFIMPWFSIILAFIVCVVVGVVSGLYPAHKASKLDPIESLRFE